MSDDQNGGTKPPWPIPAKRGDTPWPVPPEPAPLASDVAEMAAKLRDFKVEVYETAGWTDDVLTEAADMLERLGQRTAEEDRNVADGFRKLVARAEAAERERRFWRMERDKTHDLWLEQRQRAEAAEAALAAKEGK